MKSVDYIELNTLCNHLLLHDRAGTFASLLYKAEKPSVCLRHGIISEVSAWVDLGFGLCIDGVFET